MIKTVVGVTMAIGSVLGAGWGANVYLSHTFAEKESMKLAESKIEKVQAQAEYTLDRQMRALERDINRLVDKQNKTPDDVETLRYLRETLKEMREVRRTK